MDKIIGHSEYEISPTSQVYRVKGGRKPNEPIKQTFHVVKGKQFPNGYYYVTLLSSDSQVRCMRSVPIHRLLAIAFIPNPLNLPQVNHKDGNKLNNQLDNLEWSSISDNIKHSYAVLGRVIKKGKEHWLTGKKHSDETKDKMRKAKEGKQHFTFKGYYITPLGRFKSAQAGAIAHNTYPKDIFYKCKRSTKHIGYSFELV